MTPYLQLAVRRRDEFKNTHFKDTQLTHTHLTDTQLTDIQLTDTQLTDTQDHQRRRRLKERFEALGLILLDSQSKVQECTINSKHYFV